VFGSVAVGPFNYETVTAGNFETTLRVQNFTLAQIGLLALALRDLSSERIRLGFAKSRGLGLIKAQVKALALRYPLCDLEGEQLRMLGGKEFDSSKLYGVGSFVEPGEDYGYPTPDQINLPPGYEYTSDGWLGSEIRAPGADGDEVDWQSLGRACVPKWKAEVEHGE